MSEATFSSGRVVLDNKGVICSVHGDTDLVVNIGDKKICQECFTAKMEELWLEVE